MPQGKIGIEDLGQDLKNKINKSIEISAGVENGDYTYVHPNDFQTRHVTDLEKATWNDKANKTVASTTADGLMSSADKIKLNSIASNANNYSHPGTHPASMISIADTSNLFAATDVEGALKEVFTNASNGKSAIAIAVTGKGVAASANDTFSTLATKIGQINTGYSRDYLVQNDVIGYTFTPNWSVPNENFYTNKDNWDSDDLMLYLSPDNSYMILLTKSIWGETLYGAKIATSNGAVLEHLKSTTGSAGFLKNSEKNRKDAPVYIDTNTHTTTTGKKSHDFENLFLNIDNVKYVKVPAANMGRLDQTSHFSNRSVTYYENGNAVIVYMADGKLNKITVTKTVK